MEEWDSEGFDVEAYDEGYTAGLGNQAAYNPHQFGTVAYYQYENGYLDGLAGREAAMEAFARGC